MCMTLGFHFGFYPSNSKCTVHASLMGTHTLVWTLGNAHAPLHSSVMTSPLLSKSALPVLWRLAEKGVSNTGYLEMNVCV